MKRFSMIPVLLSLAVAAGPEIGGTFAVDAGLRPADLTTLPTEARLTLRVQQDLEDAGLIAELRVSPEGIGLGEAYAQFYLGPVDLSVGRIIVHTGRLDYFAPLDAFNPKDLSRPTTDPTQQKIPLEAIELAYYLEDAELQLLLAPRFVPSIPPQGEWARPSPLPAGVVRVEETLPAPLLTNAVIGVRATTSLDLLNGLDLGATLLRTFTPFPGLKALLDATDPERPCPDPTTGPCLAVLGHDRLTLLGGDLALAFELPPTQGEFLLRAEGAVGITADLAGRNPWVADGYYEGALELEHTLPEGPTLIALYHGRYLPSAGWTHHLGVLLHHEADERTVLEAAWLHNLSDGSGTLLPRARYQLTDGAWAELRLLTFYGPDTSEFGVWRELGQLGAGLRFAF